VSEKQARRIVQCIVERGYMRVIGNEHGGKPGSTKHFQIEVGKLRDLVLLKESARTTPMGVTPPAGVTPPMHGSRTPPTQGIDPSHGCPSTPPTGGSLTTIEPPIEPLKRETPRKRSTAPTLAKPADVEHQTWADWLTLRKAKRAPVTQTTVDGAREEAAKADMSLEVFLKVWCRRGSQGLEADWLKPSEKPAATTANRRVPAPDNFAARVYVGGKL
jgi:hypothetical protein